jgi:DNA-binding NarL/FixJ family response regulator
VLPDNARGDFSTLDSGDGAIIELLTDRELEILDEVARGSRNRDIARALHITIKTVEFHLANIFSKLGVSSRTGAVVRATQVGWLKLAPIQQGSLTTLHGRERHERAS